jgi:Na+/H+ antiporter NhaD/arsenite permease-like protein
MAANTASAVLVSSNPTNILITGSFQLNYLTGFTKWTILPSIVPAVLNYGIILLMFRKAIPKNIVPLQDNPWSKLRDPVGAVFLTVLMLVAVAVLVGTSFVPGHAVEVWMVTAPAGILALLFNIIGDWRDPDFRKRQRLIHSSDPAATAGPIDRIGSNISWQNARTANERTFGEETPDQGIPFSEKVSATNPKDTSEAQIPGNTAPPPQSSLEKSTSPHKEASLTTTISSLADRFPSTAHTLVSLPIPLLPFAMCEFIMVRGLAQRGWIHVFAQGFAQICTTPAATVFFMGFFCAAFLCPLAGTNIGATIILVEIMRDPAFSQSEAVLDDPRVLLGAIYAVAMGSNLGAFSFTFAGSLAGLLWRALLYDSAAGRIEISQLKFARINLLPLLMQTSVACAIIWGQLYWFA